MRSLFHFPFPAQPPSQQPSHCSQKCAIARILHPCAASAAPQFCFPPPARSPVPRLPDPGPLSPAPRAPAIPRRRPCLTPLPALIAPHHLSTAPLPPAPIGLASSASRPPHAVARIASTPLRAAIRIPLCRHRADSALIAPPSRPSCAAAVLYVLRFAARIAPTVRRHPRHPPHLSPRVAAAPGPWLARTAPHASLFRRMREKGPLPGNIRPKCMLFEIKMATSSPHASISGRNRAIRDTWRANLAAKGPFRVEEPEITHGAKMLPAPPGLSAAAACGPAERALRPAARAWPACRMRPPCHLACARRGLRSGRTGFAPCSRASPSETRHAVPVPMHLATCAPHPSRQPRAPTASRKQAEQRKQLNAGIKIGSPNGDPIEEFFGFAQRLPDALQPLHQANELALSYLDHSTRQRLGGYVIGLSGNSFTVDLYAALVDHATSIAR